MREISFETEVWKDIVGYEGLYQVSNYGRVKHLNAIVTTCSGTKTTKERVLTPHIQNSGYLMVDLYKDNKRKNMLVHRLVAMAFVPNPNCLKVVNHKDSTRTNCHAENLEWCTMSYNHKYSYDNNNRRQYMNWKSGKDNANSKPVFANDKNGKFVFRFDSIAEAERKTGILNNGIVQCLKGRSKTAGGYIWHYE